MKQYLATLTAFVQREPARAFLILRAALYLVAATWAVLSAEEVEAILTLLGALLGVDITTTEQTRARVFAPEIVKEIVDDKSELTRLAFEVAEVIKPSRTTSAELIGVVAPILKQHRGQALTSELKSQVATEIHSALKPRKPSRLK